MPLDHHHATLTGSQLMRTNVLSRVLQLVDIWTPTQWIHILIIVHLYRGDNIILPCQRHLYGEQSSWFHLLCKHFTADLHQSNMFYHSLCMHVWGRKRVDVRAGTTWEEYTVESSFFHQDTLKWGQLDKQGTLNVPNTGTLLCTL